jgi:hypothetical protein
MHVAMNAVDVQPRGAAIRIVQTAVRTGAPEEAT